MRILLAHDYYRSSAPSGEDAVFRNERALLEKNRIEVIPFERFNDDIDDSSLSDRLRLAGDGAWSKRTHGELSDVIRRTRPDLAHFHNTFPLISPSAYAACQDNGVPVVQTLHNYRLVCLGGLLMRDGRPCEDCVGTSTSRSASLMHATTAIPLRRTMDGRVEKARRTISDQEIRAAI